MVHNTVHKKLKIHLVICRIASTFSNYIVLHTTCIYLLFVPNITDKNNSYYPYLFHPYNPPVGHPQILDVYRNISQGLER